MREIYSDIEVKAGPEKVWELVTNFEKFPEWNPFIKSCSGEAVEGGSLEMKVASPGDSETAIRSKVLAANAPKEFRWMSGSPMLFSSEHVTTIQPIGEQRVRVVQRGMYSGMLVPFKGGQIDKLKRGLDAMNQAIVREAEKN